MPKKPEISTGGLEAPMTITNVTSLLHPIPSLKKTEAPGRLHTTISSSHGTQASSYTRMIVSCLELSDKYPSHETLSSPQLMLSQIKNTCRKHGVKVYGESIRIPGTPDGMDQIKQNIIGDNTFN